MPNTGDDAEYPNVNEYIFFFLQIFRNSVGDLAVPDYSFWSGRISNTEENKLAHFMIAWAWALWTILIFFMLIILLNFLIAIISQSYDSVMTRQTQIVFTNKTEINVECCLLLDIYQNIKNLGGDNNKSNVFTLRTTIDKASGNEQYFGFVKPIKHAVKVEVNSAKGKIAEVQKDVENMKKKLEGDIKKCLDKL